MTKTAITILGVLFLIAGLWGLAAHSILGIFSVNMGLSVIHLITGVLALWVAAASEETIKTFSKTFGVIYGFLAIIGIFSGTGVMLGFIANNTADTIANVVVAALFFYFGFSEVGEDMRHMRPMQPMQS